MAAVGLHPAALRRALRILDEDAALRAFHEADEGDDDDRAANDGEDRAAAHRAFADLREHLREAARQLGENARHDDQRNAVADAAAGALFPEPPQEERAADDRDHGPDKRKRVL